MKEKYSRRKYLQPKKLLDDKTPRPFGYKLPRVPKHEIDPLALLYIEKGLPVKKRIKEEMNNKKLTKWFKGVDK